MDLRRWNWSNPSLNLLIGDRDWSSVSLDFIKFLVSGLGFGVVVLGYSYTHTFFRSFGLSLFQLEMSSIDIIYRGVALILTPKIAVFFPLVILVSTFLLVVRPHLHQFIGLLGAGMAVTILMVGTLLLGTSLGEDHAKGIWAYGKGKKVFCRFHAPQGDPLKEELLPVLDKLGTEERLQLIHLGREIIYLAPKLDEVPRGRRTGESYAVPTSLLRFCRIVGT